jgi:hypothetical protein
MSKEMDTITSSGRNRFGDHMFTYLFDVLSHSLNGLLANRAMAALVPMLLNLGTGPLLEELSPLARSLFANRQSRYTVLFIICMLSSRDVFVSLSITLVVYYLQVCAGNDKCTLGIARAREAWAYLFALPRRPADTRATGVGARLSLAKSSRSPSRTCQVAPPTRPAPPTSSASFETAR